MPHCDEITRCISYPLDSSRLKVYTLFFIGWTTHGKNKSAAQSRERGKKDFVGPLPFENGV
jgi:hypothetical protein